MTDGYVFLHPLYSIFSLVSPMLRWRYNYHDSSFVCLSFSWLSVTSLTHE